MKLKLLQFEYVDKIQESVTDKYSATYQKVYDRVKASIYSNGAYFE